MSTVTGRQVRVRPSIRRLAKIALPILLIAAAHSVWDYVEIRRVEHELDRIRAKGQPFSYAKATHQPGWETKESYNAGRYYLSAAMFALPTGQVLQEYSQFGRLQAWMSGREPRRPDVLSSTERANAFLRDWRPAFELVDAASELPFHVFPAGTEYNYLAAGLSNLTRLNNVRTLHASASGDGDAAVRSVIAGVRLRRALRASPFLVADHDDEIPEVLSLSRPSREALRLLQQVLGNEAEQDTAADDLIRERGRYLDTIVRRVLYYNLAPGGPVDLIRTPVGGPSILVAFWRPWRAREVTHTLREWADLIDIAGTPWPQRAKRMAPVLAKADADIRRPRWFPMLPPIYYARVVGRPERLILDRSSQVAAAIERYRWDHETLPEALDALVPEYLATVPVDPLNGKPLRYRRTPDWYAVYSVGRDDRDDGAEVNSGTAAAGRLTPAVDIGIRVLITR